ncbi:MAG TPA: hypothetical protein VFO10_18305 [Oligoflexus sp.]|uniref:hypothetical protein n=1 Tax=Oligoflexus sp. TaxID=1971216 RepID=UPI002D80FDD8|nr:hypothetical protein [Oligoflexus sp.]HET9239219.1 hypothetical protein [Oligoflexus sp.]
MQKVEGHFEDLHWTECNIKKTVINRSEKNIEVWAEFLEVYPPHPFSRTCKSSDIFIAVFENVHSSKLAITEYIGDASEGQVKPTVTKVDCFREEKEESDCGKEFSLEGVLLDDLGRKHAWISWDIVAEKFYLERKSQEE